MGKSGAEVSAIDILFAHIYLKQNHSILMFLSDQGNKLIYRTRSSETVHHLCTQKHILKYPVIRREIFDNIKVNYQDFKSMSLLEHLKFVKYVTRMYKM